jgi:hypothetical protein
MPATLGVIGLADVPDEEALCVLVHWPEVGFDR